MACELDAHQAVARMRAGELAAEEYARALLDRAAALADLNAFLGLDRETVLASARRADLRRAAGAPLGKLHGLPLPVKDSVNTSALATTNGTAALRGFRPRHDAAVLARLFGEGAILMGKTSLHELSDGWTCNNAVFGAVRNPHAPGRVPGGSSGGSAVAVAAGMAPLAVAGDTLGSIRVPAALCGVAGLRPSVGRYPGDGVMPITPRWDVVGPLARSVRDLALFDVAASGEDVAIVEPATLAGVRLAAPGQLWSELDAGVSEVAWAAVGRLQGTGALVTRAPLPAEMETGLEISRAVHRFEQAAHLERFLRVHGAGIGVDELIAQASPPIRDAFRAHVLPGAPGGVGRTEYEAALERQAGLRAATVRYFARQRIAALVFPAVRVPAPWIGEEDTVEIAGRRVPFREAMARNAALGSCGGMASLVLPAGATGDGSPVGLEFAALPGHDRELLGLGLALERALGSGGAGTAS